MLIRIRPKNIKKFNLETLAMKSSGFCGSEIEQAIIEGMHYAFNEKREFTEDDILLGIKQIIPIAQIEPERIKQIQNWALSGRIRLASETNS